MVVTINKSIASGVVVAPPSKSYAHRLLICAALSSHNVTISNIVLSKDIEATINAIIALGNEVIIEGKNIKVIKKEDNIKDIIEFDCNESGSTFRFMIPIALTTGKKIIVKGTKRLIERGILPYEEIFKSIGIEIIKYEDKLELSGKLVSGKYYIQGDISSQFISGLLFALPLVEGKSEIIVTKKLESKNYVDMTIDALSKARISIKQENNHYYIENNKYNMINEIVEGDYSNAAFLDIYNYLDGNVLVEGLNPLSYQGDKVYKEYFKKLNDGFCTIDISNSIDLGPILFCFASLKHGGHFINTARLKIKESNRVEDLKEELEKFGIEVMDNGNEVIINNSNLHKPNEVLNGKNDHRIVMALSMMLTKFGGSISGCNAVAKSYPNFFEDLKSINIEVIRHDEE